MSLREWTPEEVANALEAKPAGEGKWTAHCPAHGDITPSLSIGTGERDKVLLHCHAGCSYEAISAALNGRAPTVGRTGHRFGEPVATYDYTDENGSLLFQVQRDGSKNFRQRRPSHAEPPADAWIYDVRDVRKVPYRLPEILSAVGLQKCGKFDQPIFVVEGEKDVHTLNAFGLVATTSAGGAGKWTADHAKALVGASDVVVIPDADAPGLKHARAVVASLHGVVASVKILELPGLPEKGDVSDWIATGGTKDKLLALAERAPQSVHPRERFLAAMFPAPQFLGRVYPEPRHLVGKGVFCRGDLGILYGVPGGGKTFAALQLALALVRGTKWLGLPTGDGEVVRVGILELELHAFRLQGRLRTVAGEAGLNEGDAGLQIVSRPDLDGRVDMLEDGGSDLAALTAWCRDERLDLLIVDALNRVHSVDENQSSEMGPLLAAFDELRHSTGAAVLLLHHEPKTGAGRKEIPDLEALRGSTRLRDDPNVLMRLVKKPGDLRCLRFPKVNNAEEPAPVWLARTASGPLEVTESPEMRADRTRDGVRKVLLEAGPEGLTQEDLVRRTGLGKSAAANYRKALGAIPVPGSKPPRYVLPAETAEGGGADAR